MDLQLPLRRKSSVAKFIKHTIKNNKNKSFTSVDTATNRGMGRFNHGSGSGGGIGPRVITLGLWLVDDEMNGAVDTNGNAIVLVRTF
jgi:hypothetical protein